ncbi:MAG: hypothetical protein QF441_01135 [Bacteriovoracaceae bacterium]|jgi:hypothetical protein|nr:hypothetical protein [Bacteriovoracaceae bacterium]
MNKILFFTNFLFFLLYPYGIYGQDNLKYDQRKSVQFNEQQFVKNMQKHCRYMAKDEVGLGYKYRETIETYPEELLILFFKKHIDGFCYYNVSVLAKHLHKKFKKQVEDILHDLINICLTEKKYDAAICKSLLTQSSLYDLTLILGTHCTKRSFSDFRIVNCSYKKLVDKKCSLYNGNIKNKEKCPFYFQQRKEAQDLHKVYYGQTCKKPRWKPLACLSEL